MTSPRYEEQARCYLEWVEEEFGYVSEHAQAIARDIRYYGNYCTDPEHDQDVMAESGSQLETLADLFVAGYD